MLVYLATNSANGKRYVGQTRLPLRKRWRQHVRDAGNGSATLIARAIRKYGAEAFSVSILCTCTTQAELDAAEIRSILAFQTHRSTGQGYNITHGGFGGKKGEKGPMRGKQHSVATIGRMRKAHAGVHRDNGLRGHKYSVVTRENVRRAVTLAWQYRRRETWPLYWGA